MPNPTNRIIVTFSLINVSMTGGEYSSNTAMLLSCADEIKAASRHYGLNLRLEGVEAHRIAERPLRLYQPAVRFHVTGMRRQLVTRLACRVIEYFEREGIALGLLA